MAISKLYPCSSVRGVAKGAHSRILSRRLACSLEESYHGAKTKRATGEYFNVVGDGMETWGWRVGETSGDAGDEGGRERVDCRR